MTVKKGMTEKKSAYAGRTNPITFGADKLYVAAAFEVHGSDRFRTAGVFFNGLS
jgi:hypothetical protein